jgi:hypothetical protein
LVWFVNTDIRKAYPRPCSRLFLSAGTALPF